MKRRDFLFASMGVAGGLAASVPARQALRGRLPPSVTDAILGRGLPRGDRPFQGPPEWGQVRSVFPIDRAYIHMAGLFLASHPEPVAEAIERFREALDANPTLEVTQRWGQANETRRAAAAYVGGDANDIALTGSTTMSLAMAIHGSKLPSGSEILHTTHDHFVANQAIEFKAQHAGATIRRVSLYDDDHPEQVSTDLVVSRLQEALRPETRLFLATWVHSKNGVKLPVAEMSRIVDRVNASRNEEEKLIFVVDGVHGFGVENVNVPDLGCDFFAAGTHKWLFGPRGTGILWGNPRSHHRVTPIIPAMASGSGWGGTMSPGGFHAFEHRWALYQAFEFHLSLGKAHVQSRIHGLNTAMKEGLKEMAHVRLYTPLDPSLSSGVVCFDVEGMTPQEVTQRLLRRHRIVSSATPYDPSHARFTPGLLNDEGEVEESLEAVRAMA